MLPIFEIIELSLSPTWMSAPAATVSLRVRDVPADIFIIRGVSIYRQDGGRPSLGPPFVWGPDWTGQHRGLGFASAEICEAAAAEVIRLITDACPALAGAGRP